MLDRGRVVSRISPTSHVHYAPSTSCSTYAALHSCNSVHTWWGEILRETRRESGISDQGVKIPILIYIYRSINYDPKRVC